MAVKPEETSALGVCSEMRAILYLLESGYHVFKNVMPTGAIDIVAWKPNSDSMMAIDVKTIRKKVMADGSVSYTGKPKNKKHDCVFYLGYCPDDDSFVWFD